MSKLTEQQIDQAKRYIQQWTGWQVEKKRIEAVIYHLHGLGIDPAGKKEIATRIVAALDKLEAKP